MRKDNAGREGLQPFADVDKVIHEPTRLMLMAYLYVVASADFVFLMHETGLTRGNLSSHMSKLETAGYVKVEKAFVDKKPRTLYSLSDEGRAAFRFYREDMKKALNSLPD